MAEVLTFTPKPKLKRALPSTALNCEQVRVLRVLEYTGPRWWVENCLAERAVKGQLLCSPVGRVSGGAIIREAILGETQEILDPEPTEPEPKRYA